MYLLVDFLTNKLGGIRSKFLRRVLVNGMTGSRWQFKRLVRLSIIVTDVDQKNVVLSS